MSGVPITVVALPVVTPTAGDSIPVWDSETGLQGRATVTGLGSVFALMTGAAFTGTVSGPLLVAPIVQAFIGDNGALGGGAFQAYRNSNGSTPAPGHINLQRANSSASYLYSDDGQLIRVLNVVPTNANMATGTVVGTQSSSLAQKDLLPRELTPLDDVLEAVRIGAAAVRAFIYKAPVDYDGEGNLIEGVRPLGGEEFEGVIIDYAPRYAMDHDPANPEGKSLNEINIFGDLLRAVDWLVAQNDELRARVAAIEAGA